MKPDWSRIFPDADHRWIMGLRQSESAAEFFAHRDSTGAVLAERARWLAEDPDKYTALLPEAWPALHETARLASSLGMKIEPQQPAVSQLLAIGQGWEPDVVWMHPDNAGVHRLVGGVVCFPSSWALQDKVGRPMHEVHEPVPGLNAALGRQIETFLRKQEPGVPWTRENWSLSRDPQLNHHTSRPRARLDATVTADEVWFRLEHQLLLKLPESGSILFGIRMELVPLTEVTADPLASARFARILSTMSPASSTYKDLISSIGPLLSALRS